MGQKRSFLEAGLKGSEKEEPVRPIENSHVILGCRGEGGKQEGVEGLSQNGEVEEQGTEKREEEEQLQEERERPTHRRTQNVNPAEKRKENKLETQ